LTAPHIKRWTLPALALLLAGLASLVLFVNVTQAARPAQAGGPGATPNDVDRVASKLYCPVCPNTPLNVCETQACKDWRELIGQKLSAGASDQEIVDYFVTQYGQRVLATPPPRGFNLLVWIIPAAALLAGLGALAIVLRSWSGRRGPASVKTPAPPAPTELPAEYVERIEHELSTRSR
jgi:cytochrome c-type biogenesis protein CcmH